MEQWGHIFIVLKPLLYSEPGLFFIFFPLYVYLDIYKWKYWILFPGLDTLKASFYKNLNISFTMSILDKALDRWKLDLDKKIGIGCSQNTKSGQKSIGL